MFYDLRIIARDLGGLLIVLGFVMLLPVATHPLGDAPLPSVLQAFALPALTVFAAGLTLNLASRTDAETELKHALVIAAVAWLAIPALSAAPFMVLAGSAFLDGLFESMAGWTTTGFTVFPAPENLHPSLVLWRSLMEWVGGLGVVVIMLTILARPGTGTHALYRAETREERIRPSIISTARVTFSIYALLTGVALLLYLGARVPAWDALNLALTSLSTGGFSPRSGGIAAYGSPAVEAIAVALMVVGGTSFLILYKALARKGREALRDLQVRAMALLLVAGVVALTLENLLTRYPDGLSSLRFSGFQFVSALTTTGFQTASIHSSEWSATSQLILVMAMIVGGAAGSTAGGIKLVRAVTAYRGTGWWFKKASLPASAVVTFRLGEKRLSDEEANKVVAEANLITLLWVLFLFIGVVTLLHVAPSTFTLSDVLVDVASAQGNVGLSTGLAGPDLHPFGKAALIFSMWIGRLEIIPILMLFRSFFKGLEPI